MPKTSRERPVHFPDGDRLPASSMKDSLQIRDIRFARKHQDLPSLVDHELDTIADAQSKAFPDFLGNGDLAFASDSGGRHSLPRVRILACRPSGAACCSPIPIALSWRSR